MNYIKHSIAFVLIVNLLSVSCLASDNYGQLKSLSISEVYDTTDLENRYREMFCTHLSLWDCEKNIDAVKTSPDFGGFDLNQEPIIHNPIQTTSIVSHKVVYTSIAAKSNDVVILSGKIFMPNGVSKDKIKGVVLYFHQTDFEPRRKAEYNRHETHENIIYAALYASRGYVVVAPDYNGLGDDAKNVHPFVLYPRINDRSGLYLLSAVRRYINSKYGFAQSDQLKLFSVGFSEGAAYSIWFSRFSQNDPIFTTELKENNFKLEASVGIAGAYALSTIGKNFIMDDVSKSNGNPFKIENQVAVNITKPAFTSEILIGYEYMNNFANYGLDFNQQFYTMQCNHPVFRSLCYIDEHHLNLYTAFNYLSANSNSDIFLPILLSALNKKNSSGKAYLDSLFSLFSATNNSMLPLLKPNIEINRDLDQQLKAADITTWTTKLPLHFISLKYDSIVSPLNTQRAINGTHSLRGNLVTYTWINNSDIKVDLLGPFYSLMFPEFGKNSIDHVNSMTFLNINAVNYLDGISKLH